MRPIVSFKFQTCAAEQGCMMCPHSAVHNVPTVPSLLEILEAVGQSEHRQSVTVTGDLLVD